MLQDAGLRFIFFLLIFPVIIISGCNKDNSAQPPKPTPTSSYTDTVPEIDMKPLIFGSVKTDTKLSTLERWQHLVEYMTAKTGIPIEIDILDNETELLNSFTLNDMDIAFVDGLAYVKMKEEARVVPLLRAIEDGSPFTKSYIIVRKDSGLKRIEDLRHRNFAFTDRTSASGYLFPMVMLTKEGIYDINSYFSKVQFTGDEQSSFVAVYNGYVDGGIITQSIMPGEAKRLEEIDIIAETEPIPLGIMIVRKNLNKEYIEKLKNSLLKIGNTLDTRELSKIIRIDGYVEATDSDYDGIRDVLKIIKEIEKKNEESEQ